MTSLRSFLRPIHKAPGFSALVIGVLALGIGATTAIFSVVNAVLLHPFPYDDAGRIVVVSSKQKTEKGLTSVTYPDYLDWRAQSHTFAQLAYATNHPFTLTGNADAAKLNGATVSAQVWPLLGSSPLLGRTFTESEDRPGAERVCVISATLWQTRFASDPQILNRSLMLDGQSYVVVGVMPPRFKFWGADVWAPVGLEADNDMMHSRALRMNNFVVGRLRPGTSLADARTEMGVIADRLALQYPDSNKDLGVDLTPLLDSVTGPMQRPLMILLGAVACVLLIACANVTNLLLARGAARRKEMAVRLALGASRARILFQLLGESLPLALFGGGAGIVLAVWGLKLLLVLLPPGAAPAEAKIEVDGMVMLFALVLSIGTTLLFALVPAWDGSRSDVNESLKDGGRGGSSGRQAGRLRRALIVAEVALSLTLLVGAGLLIRSFDKLQSKDPGFHVENLLVTGVSLPEARYPTGTRATQFYAELLERLRHLPGATAVAASENVPFLGGSGLPLLVEGHTYTDLNKLEDVQFSLVQGDFFHAMGVRLIRGRFFTEADNATGQPVIILNEAAVKKFLPNGDPLGKQVMLGLPENLIKPGLLPPGLDKFQWATVVGVVQDMRHFGLQRDPPAATYLPVDQSWNITLLRNHMTVLVRTAGEPSALANGLRQAISALDHNQPVSDVTTMKTVVRDTLLGDRFNMLLLGTFAALALVLAVVGIYGVISWNVTQRTREMGIRQALGAARGDVLRLVVGEGMRTVALGIGIGLAASLLLTRTMQALLFETSAFDFPTFAVVAALLGVVALLACLGPARRATQVSPMVALRAE